MCDTVYRGLVCCFLLDGAAAAARPGVKGSIHLTRDNLVRPVDYSGPGVARVLCVFYKLGIRLISRREKPKSIYEHCCNVALMLYIYIYIYSPAALCGRESCTHDAYISLLAALSLQYISIYIVAKLFFFIYRELFLRHRRRRL